MSITPEESVTVEWLHTLFKEPYFSARIDADGDLYITSGLDSPSGSRSILTTSCCGSSRMCALGSSLSPQATSNFLYAKVLIPSFHVRNNEKDRFQAKYVLPYEGGVWTPMWSLLPGPLQVHASTLPRASAIIR